MSSKGVTTPNSVWDATNIELHERALYPTIRIKSDRSTGSGTIIYCDTRTEPDEDGEYGFSTYVLTNHHVVASAIRVEEHFDPLKGKNTKKDYRDYVSVEVFNYKNRSTITAKTTADAEIMAYHEKRDIALLRLRTNEEFKFVAKLLKSEDARNVHIFDKLYVVGCGLGQPPFPTSGMMTGKDHVIDHYPYWQTSAPSIFGNSGGAVFRGETLEMMGIPSRISVRGGMFGGGDAITHIGYFCPANEIHKFLRDEGFLFLLGEKGHTEAKDLKVIAERGKNDGDDEDDKDED